MSVGVEGDIRHMIVNLLTWRIGFMMDIVLDGRFSFVWKKIRKSVIDQGSSAKISFFLIFYLIFFLPFV